MLFTFHQLNQCRILSLMLACTAGVSAWNAEAKHDLKPSSFVAISDVSVDELLNSPKTQTRAEFLGDESYISHVAQKFITLKMSFFSNVLDLTPGQQRRLETIAADAGTQISVLREKIEPLSPDEQSQAYVVGGLPLAREADAHLRQILNPEQFMKLNRLAWKSQAGAVSLLHPELVRRLKLTTRQQDQLCEIIRETREEFASYDGNLLMVFQMRQVGIKARQRAESLLTPEQSQLWATLQDAN